MLETIYSIFMDKGQFGKYWVMCVYCTIPFFTINSLYTRLYCGPTIPTNSL